MNDQDELDWLFPDKPDLVDIIRKNTNTPDGDALNDLEREPEIISKSKTMRVPYGTYTVVIPGDSKPHRTIRVVPWKSQPGKSIFEMLIGPDNSLDFQGFGEQAGDHAFRIWRKFSNREEWLTAARALVTIVSEGDPDVAGEMYALMSSRCRRCNRKLTVPASIHRGYGPECAQKI